MLLLLLLLLFFFFFFFLIVLFDYSIAAAKRKLFKSEERERILRTCIRVLCVLCAKETQIYTFCGDDPQQKKILKKSSPFQHKSSLQKSSPFFFHLFSLLLLFFKKRTFDTFETKVHLVLTQLRERSVDDTNTTYSE